MRIIRIRFKIGFRIINRAFFVNTIVPDLKVNANYNFTITAKDNSNNISTNNNKITASTLSMPEVYIIDNFEGETNPWEAVEGGHGVSVVSNPLTGGINSSSYVLKGGRDAVANNWAATMLRNLSIPGGVYQYLHIMMFRDVIGTVPNVKLSDAAGGDISTLDGQIIKTGEWHYQQYYSVELFDNANLH